MKEDDEAAIIDSPIYSTDYEEIKNDDLLLVSQDEEVSTDGKITSFEGSGEEPPPILLNRFAGVTECEIKDDTVSCQGKMLNRIPDTVLSTVTTLNLNDNSFTKLSSDLFSQKLNNVKQINLANNQINSIESSVSVKINI